MGIQDLIAPLVTVVGFIVAIMSINGSIHKVRAEINARIDALEAKMDAKFAALDAKYDAKIDSVRGDILALSKDLRHSGAIPRNNLARRRLVG